ncbi:MAG: DinB family protein [Armatimonadetes bacterium]|nr:DinB family protein [Armatimonadota bacterium]
MDIRAALKGQYHASLAMLRQAIAECPDDQWAAGPAGSAYWAVAYHALFYTDFYLQANVDSFVPWSEHRDGFEKGEPYTRAQLLAYWQRCEDGLDAAVDALDLEADDCGFPWYRLTKIDHQLTNLRHIQHHVGVLSDRLRAARGRGVEWGTFD